jgi:hypothetical protein
MAIAAAGLAAAVSARESLSGSAPASRELPAGYVIETGEQSRLALEALENLTPVPNAVGPQITFAVRDSVALWQDGGSALEDMTTWQIQILNSSGKKVSFIQGSGQTPGPLLSWSGLSQDGEPLPGGFYTARLVWTDKTKKAYASQAVSFNLFSGLKMPKFAELEFDFRFIGGFPTL